MRKTRCGFGNADGSFFVEFVNQIKFGGKQYGRQKRIVDELQQSGKRRINGVDFDNFFSLEFVLQF